MGIANILVFVLLVTISVSVQRKFEIKCDNMCVILSFFNVEICYDACGPTPILKGCATLVKFGLQKQQFIN